MAKIFFDANVFIDFIEERINIPRELFEGHTLCISPLSIHIISYLYKYTMPTKKLENIERIFTIISLDQFLTINALLGPTKDLEDNIQLHSAAAAECDFFFTNDKKLLALHFFGKIRIVSEIPQNMV